MIVGQVHFSDLNKIQYTVFGFTVKMNTGWILPIIKKFLFSTMGDLPTYFCVYFDFFHVFLTLISKNLCVRTAGAFRTPKISSIFFFNTWRLFEKSTFFFIMGQTKFNKETGFLLKRNYVLVFCKEELLLHQKNEKTQPNALASKKVTQKQDCYL